MRVESPHVVPKWKMLYSAREEYELDDFTPHSWAGLVKRYGTVVLILHQGMFHETGFIKTRIWSSSTSKICKYGALKSRSVTRNALGR